MKIKATPPPPPGRCNTIGTIFMPHWAFCSGPRDHLPGVSNRRGAPVRGRIGGSKAGEGSTGLRKALPPQGPQGAAVPASGPQRSTTLTRPEHFRCPSLQATGRTWAQKCAEGMPCPGGRHCTQKWGTRPYSPCPAPAAAAACGPGTGDRAWRGARAPSGTGIGGSSLKQSKATRHEAPDNGPGGAVMGKKKTSECPIRPTRRLVGNRRRLVCNRWRLVGNRWRLVGSHQTSESGCHGKKKRVSVLMAPPVTDGVTDQEMPYGCPHCPTAAPWLPYGCPNVQACRPTATKLTDSPPEPGKWGGMGGSLGRGNGAGQGEWENGGKLGGNGGKWGNILLLMGKLEGNEGRGGGNRK